MVVRFRCKKCNEKGYMRRLNKKEVKKYIRIRKNNEHIFLCERCNPYGIYTLTYIE